MVNTYTWIKFRVCPTFLYKFLSKCDVIPKLRTSLLTSCCTQYNFLCLNKSALVQGRANFIFRFRSIQFGYNAIRIQFDCTNVCGKSSVSLLTVHRKNDTPVDHEAGWPVTDASEQNILMVRRASEEDQHVSIRERSTTCGLPRATGVDTHLLTEGQKKQRVACSKKLHGMFKLDGTQWRWDTATRDETRI